MSYGNKAMVVLLLLTLRKPVAVDTLPWSSLITVNTKTAATGKNHDGTSNANPPLSTSAMVKVVDVW